LDLSFIPLGHIDISSRPYRRKAISRIIGVLYMIYSEEEAYMKRMPLSFHGSRPYGAAEDSLYYLVNAIFALEEAY
jgi:hypothetical protein